MTLVIGVRCGDGVVMGSDGVTTYSSFAGYPTIQQQTGSKIQTITNNALFAAAGDVGVGQEILDKLQHKWDSINKRKSKYHEVRKEIANTISGEIKHYAKRIEQTLVVADRGALADSRNQISRVEFDSVICTPIGDEFHLFQFDQHGNPVELKPELTFIAIGSGQSDADLFLKFVKRVAWEGGSPATVRQGIIGVLWTLQYVTTGTANPGVGEPLSIGVLKKVDGKWESSVFEGESLHLFEDDIRIAEQALRENLNKEIESAVPPVREH